jgi:Spy/CpxP family protein refolding chaperone
MKNMIRVRSAALLFASIAVAQGLATANVAGPTDAAGSGQEFLDEMRKQLVEALGGGIFVIFRDQVMEELKLSDEQKQKLLDQFPEFVQATMHVFERIQDAKPEGREKEMQAHREKSEAQLTSFLKEVLDDKQRARLFQLQLQQAGVFALLGENEAFKPLKITAPQRKRFRELVHDMEKKTQATIQEAGNEPKPEEILPRVRKIRKDYAGKLEALLSEGQKKAWKELLGKPFELGD